ncbi:hypothetical protein HI914_00439 [Erysiphe necator]|nr:hypothetical protein HI914_00439 [Erysiphe necator]
MGQQQSIPENGRVYEQCLPRCTSENGSKYCVSSQSASKSSSSKRSSAYTPSDGKSFNSLCSKPPLDLNKELPNIKLENQKRSSNFRSRLRNLKAQMLIEETDNLRSITHLFSKSDLSCYSDSYKRTRPSDYEIATNSSKDYLKNNPRSQQTTGSCQDQLAEQNFSSRLFDERPLEFISTRYEPHVTGKNIKLDSQTGNSKEMQRNSFLHHNIAAKLVPKSKSEICKSFPTSRRQTPTNLPSYGKEKFNGTRQAINKYQPNVKDSFQPQRTVTPNDLDYRHIGAFKLGTLRITNGVASPAPSIECGIKSEKRPQSSGTSTLHDSIQYKKPPSAQETKVKPWIVNWGSPLRKCSDHDLGTPETLSLNLNADIEEDNSSRLNFEEEKTISIKPESEPLQSYEDPFHHSMISPYSLVDLVEPSPPPQRAKMELAVRDSLFDEEPWTPTVLYHPLYKSENRTPQILGEDRGYLTLKKPIAEADSGYRSNISVRSTKTDSLHSPDWDEISRASRSNSAAFSFVSSSSHKDDQSNHNTNDILSSESTQLKSFLEDGKSSQKDSHIGMTQDIDALTQKFSNTIIVDDTTVSCPMSPYLKPTSSHSSSNSQIDTSKIITNSPEDNFSLQLLPLPLFTRTEKEISENQLETILKDSPIEELNRNEINRNSILSNHTLKSLLLQNPDMTSPDSDKKIEKSQALMGKQNNLDKAFEQESFSSSTALDLSIEEHQKYSPVTKKMVVQNKDQKIQEVNQAEINKLVNSSLPANFISEHKTTKLTKNQEENSLHSISSSSLLSSEEKLSPVLNNKNIKIPILDKKSPISNEHREENDLDQNSQNKIQRSSPPIPRRSELRASRKDHLIPSEESNFQQKPSPKLEENKGVTRGKVRFSIEEQHQKNVSSIQNFDESSNRSEAYQVTYRLGKYNQIGPRPVIVPTMVATFQAIEKINTQKENPLIGTRKDSFFKKNKAVENPRNYLDLRLAKEPDTFKVEKLSGLEGPKRSESNQSFQQKSSVPSVGAKIPFKASAKDELKVEVPQYSEKAQKMNEHNRPKRYRSSSSVMAIDTAKIVPALQTRNSFEESHLRNRTWSSNTSRIQNLRQEIGQFITSRSRSSTLRNDPDSINGLEKGQGQNSQRQDSRRRSSNTILKLESKEKLDELMIQNSNRKAHSNMPSNFKRSYRQEGFSKTARYTIQSKSDANLPRAKTLSPPRRKLSSHPPQAHVTRRSYSLLNQSPPMPKIPDFYTFIENIEKERLEMHISQSKSQSPSLADAKISNQELNVSLLGSFLNEFTAGDFIQSQLSDNKINYNEEKSSKIESASEKSFLGQLTHLDSLAYSKNYVLCSDFINSRKLSHVEHKNIFGEEERSDEKNENIWEEKSLREKISTTKNENVPKKILPKDSVLNRGRPISRAAETALLSKRSDPHTALKLNPLIKSKNDIIKGDINFHCSINSDNGTKLTETQSSTYSRPKLEPSAKLTLENMYSNEKGSNTPKNSCGLLDAKPEPVILNSIDTLPSQKMANLSRNTISSISLPSQRIMPRKSRSICSNIEFCQNSNDDLSLLQTKNPKFLPSEEPSNDNLQSPQSKSPTSNVVKRRQTLGALPLDELVDKTPLLINTFPPLHDDTKIIKPSPTKISSEIYVKSEKKEFLCKDVPSKEDQENPANAISSLDSLPSQCKNSKLRNSNFSRRQSFSPNKFTSTKNQNPEIEHSQILIPGSNGISKLESISSRQNDQDQAQILSNSSVYRSNQVFAKNFPTIPKSISTFHNPPTPSPLEYNPSPSIRAITFKKNDSDGVITSPFSYTSPSSSISNEEERDILVLEAGWRKNAAFPAHNSIVYTQSGLGYSKESNMMSNWTEKFQGNGVQVILQNSGR